MVRNGPAELAAALHLLLDDPGRRAAMGAAGRQRFVERLAWEHQAEAYLEVWDRLCKTAPQSAGPSKMPRQRRRSAGRVSR